MVKKLTTKRRNFIKLGLGAGAVGIAAPHLWIPRRAQAAFNYADKDNHVIVLNLDGGARSVPMFNASMGGRWNPYGEHASAAEWAVGGVFLNQQISDPVTAGLTDPLPSITDIATDICAAVTMDHTPGAATGEGNHQTARNYIAAGEVGGGPGLFSHVMKRHKYYGSEVSDFGVFPPVVIGGGDATTPFAAPAGDSEPLKTNSFMEFAAQSGDGSEGEQQPDWARAFEAGLDKSMKRRLSARDKTTMGRLALGKDAVEHFRTVFTDPALKVQAEPAAIKDGFTNAQLEAVFGTSTFGRDAALATRFLFEGSTAVLLGNGGWDTHSSEMGPYMTLAQTLERVMCGFNYMLKRMPHPSGSGVTYWDKTIVVLISEFGRDNLMGSGYNSGGGSDHTGQPGSRFQSYAMMGGPIAGGTQLGQTDSETMDMVGTETYSTRDYLSTLLAFLDVDAEDVFPGSERIEAMFV